MLGFYFAKSVQAIVLWMPFWALTLIAMAAAGVAWFGSRFSLRTLLIATTLVAVAFGIMVTAA